MPSTHVSLHIHLVFSTKDRRPSIHPFWKERLHAYLGGVAHQLGAVPEAIGGTEDHVHIMAGLRATHRLSDFLRDMKHASSCWVHETLRLEAFAWQEGYGAFSVSVGHRQALKAYIGNQAQHHRNVTFQKEYLQLLEEEGVAYDERYLW